MNGSLSVPHLALLGGSFSYDLTNSALGLDTPMEGLDLNPASEHLGDSLSACHVRNATVRKCGGSGCFASPISQTGALSGLWTQSAFSAPGRSDGFATAAAFGKIWVVGDSSEDWEWAVCHWLLMN